MPDRIPTYRPPGAPKPTDRHRTYDRHARDREASRFYRSRAWLAARELKLRRDPLCEQCRRRQRLTPATVVHHVVERRERPDLALDLANLESLCASCHSRHHANSCVHVQ